VQRMEQQVTDSGCAEAAQSTLECEAFGVSSLPLLRLLLQSQLAYIRDFRSSAQFSTRAPGEVQQAQWQELEEWTRRGIHATDVASATQRAR